MFVLCLKQTSNKTVHTQTRAYARLHSPFGKIFAIRRFADIHISTGILQDLLFLLGSPAKEQSSDEHDDDEQFTCPEIVYEFTMP